jgi:hypothetical protein
MAEGAGDAVRAVGRSEGLDAVRRMADDVVDVADDWGWKGGKPGELTGGEYASKRVKVSPGRYGVDELDEDVGDIVYNILDKRNISETDPNYWNLWDDVYEDLQPLSDKTTMRAYRQLSRSMPDMETAADVDTAMLTFKALEDADVPRKWTGKVYRAVQGSEGLSSLPPEMYAGEVSNAMRPLTNDQRETFLSLLPEWSGSLADLADAARSL